MLSTAARRSARETTASIASQSASRLMAVPDSLAFSKTRTAAASLPASRLTCG